MKPLPIVMALLAGGCVAGIFYMMNTGAPPVEVAKDEVPVVWAKDDIQATSELTAESFEVKMMPKELLPDGYFSDEDVKNLVKAGRKLYAVTTIPKKTVLTQRLFSETAGVKGLLTSGMRAFSIPINDVANAVGNFISPGDYVDVMLTLTTGEQGDQFGGALTRTLLQKVKLLAVGSSFTVSNSKDGKKEAFGRHITVELKPDQVSELQLAANQGTLSLMLRREGDTEDVAGGRATRRQLLGDTDNKDPGSSSASFDMEKAVSDRLDQLDKQWQAKFDALKTTAAPGVEVRPGGLPSFLTIQMFRGAAPTAVKIKMPPKKSPNG